MVTPWTKDDTNLTIVNNKGQTIDDLAMTGFAPPSSPYQPGAFALPFTPYRPWETVSGPPSAAAPIPTPNGVQQEEDFLSILTKFGGKIPTAPTYKTFDEAVPIPTPYDTSTIERPRENGMRRNLLYALGLGSLLGVPGQSLGAVAAGGNNAVQNLEQTQYEQMVRDQQQRNQTARLQNETGMEGYRTRGGAVSEYNKMVGEQFNNEQQILSNLAPPIRAYLEGKSKERIANLKAAGDTLKAQLAALYKEERPSTEEGAKNWSQRVKGLQSQIASYFTRIGMPELGDTTSPAALRDFGVDDNTKYTADQRFLGTKYEADAYNLGIDKKEAGATARSKEDIKARNANNIRDNVTRVEVQGILAASNERMNTARVRMQGYGIDMDSYDNQARIDGLLKVAESKLRTDAGKQNFLRIKGDLANAQKEYQDASKVADSITKSLERAEYDRSKLAKRAAIAGLEEAEERRAAAKERYAASLEDLNTLFEVESEESWGYLKEGGESLPTPGWMEGSSDPLKRPTNPLGADALQTPPPLETSRRSVQTPKGVDPKNNPALQVKEVKAPAANASAAEWEAYTRYKKEQRKKAGAKP